MEGHMLKSPSKHDMEIRRYELLLEDILATAEKLPPFPDIIWKVMPLIQRMAPVGEIEAVIKYDQAITARVLALSQSAYYGRRYGIATLRDAIIVLGGQTLLQVIMTACTARYFQARISGYDVQEGRLWHHSVATALMAETLAKHLKQRRTLTIFTAALLHDIGKTVLDLYLKIHLHATLSEIREEGMDILDAERSALGIDHQKLGEIIASRWRFPPEVVAAIGYHHTPLKITDHRDIAGMVYMANGLVNRLDMPHDLDNAVAVEYDPVFQEHGITPALAEEFQQQVVDALEGIKDFLHSV
jgi:putative nucleotidyltransferase with HDIG domain